MARAQPFGVRSVGEVAKHVTTERVTPGHHGIGTAREARASDSRSGVVVLLGASTTEIDLTLRSLGLTPSQDDRADANRIIGREEPPAPQPSSQELPLLVTISDAATALGVGRSKLYDLIARGELEVVHIGRAARIPTDALRSLVQNLRERASGQAPLPLVRSARLP